MRETAIGRRRVLRLLATAGAAGVMPLAGAGAARRPARPGERRPVVAVDPGHGGGDPGAISPGGLYEKDITLAAARDLAALLAATRRFDVVLTRQDDEFVPLAVRVARARDRRADLFVSLHADALPDHAKRGLSVFTLSRTASDREAAALAVSENRDGPVDGVDLARQPREIGRILFDLARQRTGNLSIALARDLLGAVGQTAVLLEHPQRAAAFVVLTAPDIPSVLVELGCLSNPVEEHLLRQPWYQRRLALGLRRGIEAYFAAHPP